MAGKHKHSYANVSTLYGPDGKKKETIQRCTYPGCGKEKKQKT